MQRFFRSLVVAVSIAAISPAVQAADHTDGVLILDTGTAALLWVPPLASQQQILWMGDPFVRPTDAILEPDGSLLIVDPGAGTLFSMSPFAGVAPTPVRIGGALFNCWIARTGENELVLSGEDGLIQLLQTPSGPELTPLPTELVDPFDVILLQSGDILVADPGAETLVSVDPDTWLGTPLASQIDTCWTARSSDGKIVAAGPDGVYLVSEGDTTQLNINVVSPTAVAFDDHGDLFVADRGGPEALSPAAPSPPAVVKYNLQTGTETLITSGGFLNDPAALLFVPEPPRALLLISGAVVLALLSRRRSEKPAITPPHPG